MLYVNSISNFYSRYGIFIAVMFCLLFSLIFLLHFYFHLFIDVVLNISPSSLSTPVYYWCLIFFISVSLCCDSYTYVCSAFQTPASIALLLAFIFSFMFFLLGIDWYSRVYCSLLDGSASNFFYHFEDVSFEIVMLF